MLVDSGIRIDSCRPDHVSGTAPLSVQFSPHVHGGTGLFTYLWNFGDGTTSTEEAPKHIYTSMGSYLARLIVRSGTETAECTTGIQVYEKMRISCSAEPTSGEAPLDVQFSVGLEHTASGYRYEWDFEDDRASNEPNPRHTFHYAGGFKPIVTVTGNGKQGWCRTNLITVSGASGGGGGGGGGGGSATPTPTPQSLACSGTHTYVSYDTPVEFDSNIAVPVSSILTDDFPDDCRATDIKISFYLTSNVDLPLVLYQIVHVNYDWGAGNDWFDVMTMMASLSGTSIGNGCGTLTFEDGAADFSTATPPYTGTYAPTGDLVPQAIADADGRWRFQWRAGPNFRITLHCWSVTFTATPTP